MNCIILLWNYIRMDADVWRAGCLKGRTLVVPGRSMRGDRAHGQAPRIGGCVPAAFGALRGCVIGGLGRLAGAALLHVASRLMIQQNRALCNLS